MRLTVHLKNAKQDTIERKTKDGVKTVKRTLNTLSFNNVKESDLGVILKSIEEDGLGEVASHNFSGESIKGHIKKRKK